MKKVIGFALVAGTMMGLLSGCGTVTSGMPGMTPATGEAWYSKDTALLGLVFSSKIYHCPSASPDKCKQAEFVEGDAMPAVPK